MNFISPHFPFQKHPPISCAAYPIMQHFPILGAPALNISDDSLLQHRWFKWVVHYEAYESLNQLCWSRGGASKTCRERGGPKIEKYCSKGSLWASALLRGQQSITWQTQETEKPFTLSFTFISWPKLPVSSLQEEANAPGDTQAQGGHASYTQKTPDSRRGGTRTSLLWGDSRNPQCDRYALSEKKKNYKYVRW